MTNFHNLTINGKVVKEMSINGTPVYAAEPDARHLANEEAYTILSGDTVAETLTYNNKTYNVYDSIYYKDTWTDKGTGNARPWLVSDSVMMFAHHWNSTAAKSFDVTIDGQTVTVSSIAENAYVNLKQWCLANGWSESDLPGPNSRFDDIDMIKCEKPSVSLSSICPYFMSEQTMKQLFWSGTIEGAVGFSQSQATNNMIPIVFYGSNIYNGQMQWALASSSSLIKEDELKSLPAITDPQYPAYTGDSGKPKFIRLNGKDIAISQCYSSYAGPDLIKAFPFIKAFVESYGDTLNVFTKDMAYATE